MVSAATLVVFLSLLGQILAGNFIGDVMVEFNVFAVMMGDNIEFNCSAKHEDQAPLLRWYFVGRQYERTNVSSAPSQNTGNTARNTLRLDNVRRDQAGDYFCEAEVNGVLKNSRGIPITVLSENEKPRVKVKEENRNGKILLTCKVVPKGKGDLTWRKGGNNFKSQKAVQELEFEPPARDKYECFGNLTLAGFNFFPSSDYSSGARGWFQTTGQAVYLPSLLTSFFIFTYFSSH